jgi:hypothetical protein
MKEIAPLQKPSEKWLPRIIYLNAISHPVLGQMDDVGFNAAVKDCLIHIEILHSVEIAAQKYGIFIATLKGILREHFHFLTPSELKNAFTLNITGKHWKPIENYNKIDVAFICKVLDEFIYFRNEQLKEYLTKTQLEQLALPAPEMTPDDRIQFVEDCRLMFKGGIRIFPILMLYDYMVLKSDLQPDDWKQYQDKAKGTIAGKATKEGWMPRSFGEMINNINLVSKIKNNDETSEVEYLCKQLAIYEKFEQ